MFHLICDCCDSKANILESYLKGLTAAIVHIPNLATVHDQHFQPINRNIHIMLNNVTNGDKQHN